MDNKLLQLEQVSLSSDNLAPLHNIFFSLKAGENAIIFGPENSGVESMVALVLDLNESFEGSIYYRGKNIKEFDYSGRLGYRKELGYVHGNYGLISNMTVEENISLPLQYHTTLSQKDIKHNVDRLIFDLNLDYCKKLRPVDLSKSEVLRTLYARAIVMDPRLLIIEHALEGQSPLNIQSFLLNLRERAGRHDVSVLIATFEPEKFIDFSNRFIMLFAGKIVFDGTREEFVYSENRYLMQYRTVNQDGPMAIL